MKIGGQIRYGKGYKYQLHEDWCYQTKIKGYSVSERYGKLDPDGLLTVFAMYAWDGPSGPTLDTKNFMRGPLAHDLGYQFLRNGLLPKSCKKKFDQLLFDICREDGMFLLRASYVYAAVRLFADSAARVQPPRDLLAP